MPKSIRLGEREANNYFSLNSILKGKYLATNHDHKPEETVIKAIRLLLEEKQASLSVLRTGILIIVIQLFTLSILISTSRHYEIIEVKHMATVFFILNAFLIFLALYLVFSSLMRIRRNDRSIQKLKKKNERIAELLE